MRTNAVLAERLCEAKYSELYLPEGALIKDGLRPSVSAPFLRQRIYTFDSEKGMMVLSSGRCAPVPWRRA